jgi:tetratricopeptide (TPR) repeat protein
MVRAMGHRELLCVALMNLAALARKQEDYVQAHSYLEESLALSYQVEQPQVTARVLYEYAELHFDLQLVQEAKELFLAMRRIVPPGNQELFAFAQYGLARMLVAQGNLSEAREVGTESAEVFEAIQHRRAREVRLWVKDLSDALSS